eukprot:c25977_g2_i1 orf=581-1456(+)
MDSLWSREGYPHLNDCYFAIYFAFAFPVARFVLDVCIYQKLAICLINWNAGHETNKLLKEVNNAKITKCTESLWKLTYYLALVVFIYHISCNEPWFGNTDAIFHGWPYQTIKLPLKLYYTSQCGFYMYSIVALLVWETRRKDFGVMMSHHVITLVLIAYSYISRLFRIGSIVLALHDVSDLIMELAKLCKYCGMEISASICFGMFVLSWLLLRLIYFPFWIIRSSSYGFVNHLSRSRPYNTWLYYVFNTMLITLLVFHIYWWMMICFMVKKQLQNRGKVGDDVRSDSEGDN